MRTAELKAETARQKFLKQKGQKFRSRIADIQRRRMYVFSESTDIGLKVSLEGVKKLLQFLCSEKIGYEYLMTCRLNQDALEVSTYRQHKFTSGFIFITKSTNHHDK